MSDEKELEHLRSLQWHIAVYEHNPQYAYMTRYDQTGDFTFSGHSSVNMCKVKVRANTYALSVPMSYDEAQERMKAYKHLEFPWIATQRNHIEFSIEAAKRMKERRETKQDVFDANWIVKWSKEHPLTEWENEFYSASLQEAIRTSSPLTLEWLIDWLEANPKPG